MTTADEEIKAAVRAGLADLDDVRARWVEQALSLDGLVYPMEQYIQRIFLSALNGRKPTPTESFLARQMARDLSSCGLTWEEEARQSGVDWALLWKFYGPRTEIGAEQTITADRAFAEKNRAWVNATKWRESMELPGPATGVIIGNDTPSFARGLAFQHMYLTVFQEGKRGDGSAVRSHNIEGGQPGINLRSRALVDVWTGVDPITHERTGELWAANLAPENRRGGPVAMGSDRRPAAGRRVVGWIEPLALPYRDPDQAPATPPASSPLLPGNAPLETTLGVQQALIKLGYSPGKADGINGPKTAAAVRAFQAAEGLQVDGIAGPKTQVQLRSRLARAGG